MASPSTGVLFPAFCYLLLLLSASIVSSSATGASGGQELSWFAAGSRPECGGTVGECMESDEFRMDSEINRRILKATRYISYGALQRGTVPCSRRGKSYYHCVPGQANPYTRGCSHITRCRS